MLAWLVSSFLSSFFKLHFLFYSQKPYGKTTVFRTAKLYSDTARLRTHAIHT